MDILDRINRRTRLLLVLMGVQLALSLATLVRVDTMVGRLAYISGQLDVMDTVGRTLAQ